MYRMTLEAFKTQQQELHRRAARYRLVSSLKKTRPALGSISEALGKALIVLGQSLLKRAQAAH